MSSSSTAHLITPFCRDTITPSIRKSEHQTNICISTNLQGLSICLDSLTPEYQGTTFPWNADNYETNQTASNQKTYNLKWQKVQLHIIFPICHELRSTAVSLMCPS